jgi:hypothetical protein
LIKVKKVEFEVTDYPAISVILKTKEVEALGVT